MVKDEIIYYVDENGKIESGNFKHVTIHICNEYDDYDITINNFFETYGEAKEHAIRNIKKQILQLEEKLRDIQTRGGRDNS